MAKAQIIAVLDVGKTNIKLLVFDRQGRVLDQISRANASLTGPPYLRLDSEGVFDWLLAMLATLAGRWPIDTLVMTTHGGAAALIDDDGLVLPIPDYELPLPADVMAAYAEVAPPFAEGFAPVLPGANTAQHLFWLQQAFPDAFARARHILTYPQYLSWRLTGVAASEVSSLGTHTHLWAPKAHRFSSLVEHLGWTNLFPPLRPAWEVLGPIRPALARKTGLSPACQVLCGVHDSNAALLLYLRSRPAGFTLASTGTWVIVLAPGQPLDRLDPTRHTMTNVDVTGQPVATARFMGGREYRHLAGDAASIEATVEDLRHLVGQGTMALPGFHPDGPFPNQRGRIIGPVPASAAERAALAALYVALITDVTFDLLDSRGELIVDGGFAANFLYTGVLAGLRSGQAVLVNRAQQGTAIGASHLACWDDPAAPVPLTLEPAKALEVPGLQAYARDWRQRAEEARNRPG